MRIRFNEEVGTVNIDGVLISAAVLRELVNPDRRVLFRFERKDGIIQATAFDESSVIWLDKPDSIPDQMIDFGITNQAKHDGGGTA